jgi:phosphatidylinositol-3-phosphatase
VQSILQDLSLSGHARILTALFCFVALSFCSHSLASAAATQQSPIQTSGVLLQDDFNGAAIDTSKWNANSLFSGFTDTSVAISQAGQHLIIGPLPQGAAASGSHYRGVSSVNAYNFAGAYAQVEFVQPPASNTSADMMLTVGRDSGNYYRIYIEAGSLILQKRIGGTKFTLSSLAYNSVNHRFLRVRHDSTTGRVVFETAAGSGGTPGSWVQAYSEAWNTASVPLSAIQFELKGGTWTTEANPPGNVIFDNFMAASSDSSSPPTPHFGHVFLILEENHSYESIIGGASTSYLNSLAQRYGLATQYYANTHPSIGNYFMLTTGQLITNDDGFTGTVSADNLVRQMISAGKSWKSYAESLPAVGWTGGDQYPYAKRHNPFAYLTDVLNSTAQSNSLVPFSQFTTDLANNQLPNFSYILPNQLNNGHDCPNGSSCADADKLAATDNWLHTNIEPVLRSAVFQQDGLLLITWDESVDTDTAGGGGHIVTLVISPRAKPGYQSTTFYQHQNALRTVAEALGLNSFPGASATAQSMAEFFDTSTSPVPTVSSLIPTSGPISGGTAVTISGSGFANGATVMFGGVPATGVVVANGATINAVTPSHAAGAVNITVTNTNGMSGTLANGFTYTSTTETVLLSDDFNNNVIDTTKWRVGNLFSGFTDATLPIAETNQRLEIGPLPTGAGGSHYNGLVSQQRFDFTGAYAYVGVVQAPATNTTADATYTIGLDANNYYRIYEEAGVLFVQKRVASGSKVTMLSAAYSASADRYWRIRHEAATGSVVFETAPANGGAPGAWVERYREAWNTGAIPLTSVLFEMKGGTWQPEAASPGKVIFDDFKAAKP